MLENYELLTPMGNWRSSSHRIWEWTTSEDEKIMFQHFDDKCIKFIKSQKRGRGMWVKEGESDSFFLKKIMFW